MRKIKSLRLHYNPAFSPDSIVLKSGKVLSDLSNSSAERFDEHFLWEKNGVVYSKGHLWKWDPIKKECYFEEGITVKYGGKLSEIEYE